MAKFNAITEQLKGRDCKVLLGGLGCAYCGDAHYGDAYYGDAYYGDAYYGDAYYGDAYYGDAYYGYILTMYPCSIPTRP